MLHVLVREFSNTPDPATQLTPALQVNNSGATWGEALDKYPDQAWTKLLTLNVQRVFTLTQKLVPMLEKGSKRDGVGRVINVGPALCSIVIMAEAR